MNNKEINQISGLENVIGSTKRSSLISQEIEVPRAPKEYFHVKYVQEVQRGNGRDKVQRVVASVDEVPSDATIIQTVEEGEKLLRIQRTTGDFLSVMGKSHWEPGDTIVFVHTDGKEYTDLVDGFPAIEKVNQSIK